MVCRPGLSEEATSEPKLSKVRERSPQGPRKGILGREKAAGTVLAGTVGGSVAAAGQMGEDGRLGVGKEQIQKEE